MYTVSLTSEWLLAVIPSPRLFIQCHNLAHTSTWQKREGNVLIDSKDIGLSLLTCIHMCVLYFALTLWSCIAFYTQPSALQICQSGSRNTLNILETFREHFPNLVSSSGTAFYQKTILFPL